jgi:tetratricopeptide (TPR) repeat protein
MEKRELLNREDDPLYIKQDKAHKCLEEGRFEEAIGIFESISRENQAFPGVSDGIKASRFWAGRTDRRTRQMSAYDKGKHLLREWLQFERYMLKNNVRHGKSTAAIQKFAFGDIIESFARAYKEGLVPDTNILVQIGDLFKRLGNFDRAIDVFEYVRGWNSSDPSLLSKLGDCYFSVDETSKAKVLFREAFFIDPAQIELEQIESPLIHMLHTRTSELIKDPDVSIYWVPVVAEITGVFNVKREPKKGELEELRGKIKRIELEYSTNRRQRAFIEPKLLNHYFWLIDTLKILGGSKKEIDQALQRINDVNPDVFAQYLE